MSYLNYLDTTLKQQEARLQQIHNDYQALFGAIQALKHAKNEYVNLQKASTPDTSSSVMAVFPDGIEVRSPTIGGDVG